MSTSNPETLYTSNPYYTLFSLLKSKNSEITLRSTGRRLADLTRMSKALLKSRTAFQEALYLDFKKPKTETDITELYPVLSEIRYVKARLRTWMRPRNAENSIAFTGTRNKIIQTGKGTCLILAPWNYPVLLALAPLVSAIAAGNTVIIKPSEHTPHTSAMLKHFISTIFPEDEITVAEGGREAAEHLLQLPFDHIFFTGGTETGKKVMKAAAENLSPVTLELGGKTPVYIHHDSDVEDAAEKITTAKLVNGGQTCVAPDYVLVHHDVKEEFIKSLNKYFKTFYDPASPAERENFASVINESHYHRLMNLGAVKQPRLSAELLFEPVVLSDITPEHPVMHEEIFGPILPVISVINEEEAIKQIHSLPKPLGIYVFTGDRKLMKHFTQATNSGSICFNECAIHFLHPGLPFGGVGHSGMGRAHGKAGFLSFSYERVIFEQRRGYTMAKLLYPPYNKFRLKLIDLLLKYF